MQAPRKECPPRHMLPVPQGKLSTLRLQIATLDSCDNEVAWERPSKYGTNEKPTNVANDGFFRAATDRATKAARGMNKEVRQHAMHIYGRTPEGFSVHLQVHANIGIVIEFPETHAGTDDEIEGYMKQIEAVTRIKFNHKWEFSRRPRSNGWVPDPADPTKAKTFPVVQLSLRNKYEYDVVLQYLRDGKAMVEVDNPKAMFDDEPTFVLKDVPFMGRGGPMNVSVWETMDYVKPAQRFLLENKLSPGGWITVKNPNQMHWATTLCDIEAWCLPSQITPNDNDQSLCPLTVMCWDIECCNGTVEDRQRMKLLGLDKFPRASDPTNAVIQISVAFAMVDKRMLRFLLELDTTGTKNNTVEARLFEGMDYLVFYFGNELDMFVFYRDLLVYYDPDIVMSFNGDRFDWPYVIGRMGERKATDAYGRFYQLGRFMTQRWDSKYVKYRQVGDVDVPVIIMTEEDRLEGLKGKSFSLAALAMEKNIELTPELTGRISLDLCTFIRDMSGADKYLAFKNYTLDNMSERFLGDHKVDFTHNDIFDAWNGVMSGHRLLEILKQSDQVEVDAWLGPLNHGMTLALLRERCAATTEPVSLPVQRRLLGDYCMKDTLLPLRILDKLGTVMFLWQVSRVAQTPPHNIINNGQMMRVSTMFIGEAWRQGRYVIRLHNRPMPYQGATVLQPKRGYYGGVDDSCPPLDPQPPLPAGYDFSDMAPNALIQRHVKFAILTLDFKSLYPSIMLSHLLCPSNLFLADEPLTAAEETALMYSVQNPLQARPIRKVILADTVVDPVVHKPHRGAYHHDDDNDNDEAEDDDFITDEGDGIPSGVVQGQADETDYTTVCIVVTDKKTKHETRRFHKFSKHNRGIYPTLLQNLLDGREVYKNKMNLEKAVQGTIELVFGKEAGKGADRVPMDDARLLACLEQLRAAIKPLMKDKDKRVEALQAWMDSNPIVRDCLPQLVSVIKLHINIFDGRQKALKVMANSIYGVSGAKQHSPCASCQLAESVTAIGRQMIQASKRCALTTFAHYGTDVIYGDTDSIFVCISEPNDQEAWRIASEIATYITNVIFAGTINVLEDECIKRMIALFKKKNYVALENEDVKTGIYKLAEKGVATVRRDKPEVLNILARKLNRAFTELGHFPTATIARVLLRLCATHFETLVQNAFPIEAYSIAQRINKMETMTAHLTVAKKMETRAQIPINRGDTVNFVHIEGPATANARDKVEATNYLKTHPEIKVDRAYYLSNKIEKIVSSLLGLFVAPEVIAELFNTYQAALDFPCKTSLFVKACSPAQERARRVEVALDKAIRLLRMPQGNKLIEPLGHGSMVLLSTGMDAAAEPASKKPFVPQPLFAAKPMAAATAPSAPAKKKQTPTKFAPIEFRK